MKLKTNIKANISIMNAGHSLREAEEQRERGTGKLRLCIRILGKLQ